MYQFKNPQIKKYIALVTYGIVLFLGLSNIDKVIEFVKFIGTAFYPIFLGIGIAFVINLLLKVIENKLFVPIWKKFPKIGKHRRGICVFISFVFVILVLALLVIFILPQLYTSIAMLTKSIPTYVNRFSLMIYELSQKYDISGEIIKNISQNWKEILNATSNILSSTMPYILNLTKGVTSSVINLILSTTFSIYLLLSKEKMITILKKMNYAFLKRETADKVQEISSTSNKIFSNFIGGQIVEACILGGLCFIGMTIFGWPYALLISVIIAITALIPILGAYLGVIPGCFILFMQKPILAVWFLIFIICLQQIEGNVIYPKVVGGSIGLGGLWVLVAITLGGSLFGLIGMLISVPVFAVIYILARNITNNRIKNKEIPKELIEVKKEI